jgi:hypothetical protein
MLKLIEKIEDYADKAGYIIAAGYMISAVFYLLYFVIF